MIAEHAHVLAPWSLQRADPGPSIERGEGVYLFDDAGKRYLDLGSGLIAANLGHGHPAVVAAIAKQAATLCFSPPSLPNGVRSEYARELSRISPWSEGCRTFFTVGGADANDDALKIARALTGRHKVMSAYRSFHGSTTAAGTLGGENRRWPIEPMGAPGVVRFIAPFPYRSPFHTDDPAIEAARALEHIDFVLSYEGADRIAALVIEPVVGSNGIVVYPGGYLAGLRERCDAHGILLIFDEVMTGFGRTGATFASVRFGVTPDVVTFAKGATSAYVPLGGVMVRESLASAFDAKPLGAGHTYSGHPLAVAAGLAALRAYECDGLFTRALEIEAWLRDGLGEIAARVPCVGEVRGVGAMWGVELVRDEATREPLVAWQGPTAGALPGLLADLRRRGVYTFGRYNVVVVAPPLTITRDELTEGLQALGDALEALASPRT